MILVGKQRLAECDPVTFLDGQDRFQPRIISPQQGDSGYVRTRIHHLFGSP